MFDLGYMTQKACSLCQKTKPVTEFNRSASKKDGLQSKCRACSRAASRRRYRANPRAYVDANSVRRERLKQEIQSLKRGPCVDCGRHYPPVVMDFDHRDPSVKLGSISSLAHRGTLSLDRLLTEIAKCDLVCANCHRLRTHARSHDGTTRSNKKYA